MTLDGFFAAHPKLAVAFSGGADSAYLLWAAAQAGCQVAAYYVKTPFQPAFELEDARRLAGQLGVSLQVLELDVLADPVVAANPPDRCYHCKRLLFTRLCQAAQADGYPLVCDGTNASDRADDRPGMRALAELGICSPLRLCGISKAELRERSRQAGLFTHNKPAYACLATRIPTGAPLTAEALGKVERAEAALGRLGFWDLRVRVLAGAARLQLPEEQLAKALAQREAVLAALSEFDGAVLDLQPRKSEG